MCKESLVCSQRPGEPRGRKHFQCELPEHGSAKPRGFLGPMTLWVGENTCLLGWLLTRWDITAFVPEKTDWWQPVRSFCLPEFSVIYPFFARVRVLFPVFYFMCVCVLSACVYTHVCADAHRGLKRAPDALELELRKLGAVWCLVLGNELQASRTGSIPNHWAIQPLWLNF